MSQIFEFVKLRVVDVSLALVAPNRQIREAQSEWVVARYGVQGTVLVDVSRAESFEAKQADPVLDRCLAFHALTGMIHF